MKQAFLRFERRATTAAMIGGLRHDGAGSLAGHVPDLHAVCAGEPAEWTEVMIRFSLIWMVFLGIPAAFRQGAMVSVDVLYRWSPPKIKRVLDWVVCLAALALVGVIIWWGWDYANRGKVQTMIGLENVSMFWAYLAMPVGGRCSAPWALWATCWTPSAWNWRQRNDHRHDFHHGAVLCTHRFGGGVHRSGVGAGHPGPTPTCSSPSRRCSTPSTSFRWRPFRSSSWRAT
jgi:hypothetical protein